MSQADSHTHKLVTIVTEAAIENVILRDLERLGAHGYTVTDARGKGSRGTRNAGWEASSNIRIEVVCDAMTATSIATHLQANYYANYAMILFTCDVETLRSVKFDRT